MQLTERNLRVLAKDVGVSLENRAEIVRILKDDDYSADFPLQGVITYASAALLLNIIEEHGLPLKCLPLAIACVDKSLTQIGTSIKRTIEREVSKVNDISELFRKIECLYVDHNTVGPACSAVNIDEAWFKGDVSLSPDIVISNRCIVELVHYLQKSGASWATARQWMCRLFPNNNCEDLLLQTISTNWLKLQKRARQLRGRKHEAAYLEKPYAPPKRKEEEATEQEEPQASTSNSQPEVEKRATIKDILSRKYDSPVKTQLIQHINVQDKLISKLEKTFEVHQDKLSEVKIKYTDVVSKYLSTKKEKKMVEKGKQDLEREINEMKKEEKNLRRVIAEKDAVVKECAPGKVNKQLRYKQNRIETMTEFLKKYKTDVKAEIEEMSQSLREVQEELTKEKSKKRNEQKRVWWYKSKVNPLENYKTNKIKELLKHVSSLKLENDDMACQLEDAMIQPSVTTFADGKYVDAIRLVIYDFLSRNVGTKHVSSLIRSVLENLAGLDVGRLPKETLVKLMAVEADILSKKQVAKALLNTSNATLHMDATSKKQRHFYSIQLSTQDRNYSAAMLETVSGDTKTQLDITKVFLKELSSLLETPGGNEDSTEYKMLFNIKNTMADRGPTSRSWVEQLELWREEVLEKNLLPGYADLSKDSIEKLAKINDFYCGKHFLLGLAERTRVGLVLWEEEVAQVTGLISMEALPEFARWNCQKPAGLRLVRTACELVGAGAKDPHGIPEDFNAHLESSQRNHIPLFEHNRFNIIFKASSAVFHHKTHLKNLLVKMNSENKLHKAVIEDIGNSIVSAQVHAIALIEKHITTPLATISSNKDHILDLRLYYVRLREFLQEMMADPTPILNGSAVLFKDCPPIKDEIWNSIYQEISEEEEALLDQLIAVLCASYFIVCERQLFDFVHGKWACEQSDEVRGETSSVPRNNDISERDFSGLDRLLRAKSSANLDFIEGLILFVNNKTGDYLRQLSPADLEKEISTTMKAAREKAKLYKEKKAHLCQERKKAVLAKRKRKEELEKNRMMQQQRAQDDVHIDGQRKSVEEVDALLNEYSSAADQRKAISRQLKFYKTLKIPDVPHTKYFITSQEKPLSLEIVKENLIFVISLWATAMHNPQTVQEKPTVPNIQLCSENVNTLKRKLVDEAETERLKKAKKYQKGNPRMSSNFPGDTIIGQRIRHRYEIMKTGKLVKQWFKGTVLRKASGDELVDISVEDQDIVNQGFSLYIVKYDNEDQVEPFALQWDWENGDLKLL